MAYNLTDVKSIKVISNPNSENPISMTLNKNFKINPLATTQQVETAMNRIYRLSDLNADQIILNSEFNILKPAIDYEIISGKDWYVRFGTTGKLLTHEVELNTTENIINTKFSLPYNIKTGVANAYLSGNKVKIELVLYQSYTYITGASGSITIITPGKTISLGINMKINQDEPEP